MDNLTLVSYNSTGLGSQKISFIAEVIKSTKANIIMLQETWLVQGNLSRLQSIDPDYVAYGFSGVKDTDLLTGRPYGGVAILYHKTISPFVKHISVNSQRICAISVMCHNHKLLLLNGYLPVDNWSKSHVSEDFLYECDIIEQIIDQHLDYQVIIGGDLNVDFNRNNAHDCYFKSLLERHNCTACWNLAQAESDYTFSNEMNNAYSQIDHYCFDNSLLQCVKNVYVYDSDINPPGHRPIVTVMESNPRQIGPKQKTIHTNRILWHKVNAHHIEFYKCSMDNLLKYHASLDVAQCRDLHCSNDEHQHQIEQWCNSLVNICLQAGKCFPNQTVWNRSHPCRSVPSRPGTSG